ncbi:MAG: lysophospholipid acyltransferase family protein [Hyphomonadaceae bacterium]|nr:lysophospholipid acyltransferase family protein [Hyphomonadaceae bacterium]
MAVSTDVTLIHRLEDFGFGLYMGHFARMPIDRASDAGADWLTRLGPLTSAHTTALRNLRLAFPGETEAWRREVARGMWACIGRTVAEMPHLPSIHAYRADSRLTVENAERLDAIRESGRGAVFISGHFANWELMPVAIAQRPVPCQMTYRPANNPLIDARILKIRENYGAKLQSAKGVEGGVGLMRALSRGWSVALMNDQKYNEGVAAPLFGHVCMTADGPTRLARRFNIPLQPMSVKRTGARFHAVVHAPLPTDPGAPDATALPASVARINAFVEARVREAPDQWFWVHRRWPKQAWIDADAL